MKTIRNYFLFFPFFIVFLFVTESVAETESVNIDRERNKIIGYMLSKQLPALYFGEKVMDDAQAQAAFKLYIKQLDFQKRFLLQEDVDQLKAFAGYIDDNIKAGRISLPDAGYDILSEKIMFVEKTVAEMLADGKIRRGQVEASQSNSAEDFSVGIYTKRCSCF